MVLVLGGAYQGKHEFVLRRFDLVPGDILDCTADTDPQSVPSGCRCVAGFDQLVLALLDRGEDPVAWTGAHLRQLDGAVVLCRDLFCGVVPADPRLRRWREETGRCCTLLAAHAGQVYRLFCGIDQRLK